MKTTLKVLRALFIFVLVFTVCTTTAGCAQSEERQHQNLPARFVEVDESLICLDYKLGTDNYLSDGSKEHDSNQYRYVVDRVSRLVYIEIRETGKYSSGVDYLPCPDAEGNHMRYDGNLPG